MRAQAIRSTNAAAIFRQPILALLPRFIRPLYFSYACKKYVIASRNFISWRFNEERKTSAIREKWRCYCAIFSLKKIFRDTEDPFFPSFYCKTFGPRAWLPLSRAIQDVYSGGFAISSQCRLFSTAPLGNVFRGSLQLPYIAPAPRYFRAWYRFVSLNCPSFERL